MKKDDRKYIFFGGREGVDKNTHRSFGYGIFNVCVYKLFRVCVRDTSKNVKGYTNNNNHFSFLEHTAKP
jgi:hypothetical protein